jgi:hypothetical protein
MMGFIGRNINLLGFSAVSLREGQFHLRPVAVRWDWSYIGWKSFRVQFTIEYVKQLWNTAVYCVLLLLPLQNIVKDVDCCPWVVMVLNILGKFN